MEERPSTCSPRSLLIFITPSFSLSHSRNSLTNKKFRAALMDVITAADVAGGCEKGMGQLLYTAASKVRGKKRRADGVERRANEKGGIMALLALENEGGGRIPSAQGARHGSCRPQPPIERTG